MGGTKKKNQKNEGKKGGLARGAAGVEKGVGEGGGGVGEGKTRRMNESLDRAGFRVKTAGPSPFEPIHQNFILWPKSARLQESASFAAVAFTTVVSPRSPAGLV